jgi:hypothetical protein
MQYPKATRPHVIKTIVVLYIFPLFWNAVSNWSERIILRYMGWSKGK